MNHSSKQPVGFTIVELLIVIVVIAILVTVVNFGNLASIQANLGAAAFATVVILTMIAAVTFDPRLIWDNTFDEDVEEQEATAQAD